MVRLGAAYCTLLSSRTICSYPFLSGGEVVSGLLNYRATFRCLHCTLEVRRVIQWVLETMGIASLLCLAYKAKKSKVMILIAVQVGQEDY